MASKLRVEWVRLRERDANGLQNLDNIPNVAPVTAAISGTALTGAGRITVPATANGNVRFHARICSDVECIVSFAPAGDAGTSFDASAAQPSGIWVPAATPTLVPVTPGMLISAATGLAFA